MLLVCVHLFVWSYAAEHVTVICFGVCVYHFYVLLSVSIYVVFHV